MLYFITQVLKMDTQLRQQGYFTLSPTPPLPKEETAEEILASFHSCPSPSSHLKSE